MKKLNLFFTAAGRRVELIDIFRKSGLYGDLLTADVSTNAPALYFGDKYFLVPKFSDPSCFDVILKIAMENEVNYIVPLIDSELDYYCKNRRLFESHGVNILLSSDCLIKTARNKCKTYKFFKEHDIPVPASCRAKEDVRWFPVVAKPDSGSSSIGVYVFKNREQLARQMMTDDSYLFQQYIDGSEVTVDIIGDGKGNMLAVCQRLRLKVRGGEVERAITISDPLIDNYIERIVSVLKPFGIINIQLFKSNDGKYFFSEINARFGGGVTLTMNAGIDIPAILRNMLLSERIESCVFAQKDICMMRFDKAFYINKNKLL